MKKCIGIAFIAAFIFASANAGVSTTEGHLLESYDLSYDDTLGVQILTVSEPILPSFPNYDASFAVPACAGANDKVLAVSSQSPDFDQILAQVMLAISTNRPVIFNWDGTCYENPTGVFTTLAQSITVVNTPIEF